MATKNIVPRASGEGGLGTSSKLWKEVHHVTASFGDTSLIEDASNNLNLSGGPLVASSGLSGSLTQLSNGTSYIIEGSNMTVTSASNGAITLASTDTDTTYTAGSGLALNSTTFSARSSVAVTVANSKFVIDGTPQQTLSLAKGVVYYFDQSHSSNSNHPLRFSTTSNGTHASGGAEFTDGVTTDGTPGNAGAYTQVILEQDAPSVLYYYCSQHSGMGGKAETAPDALLTGDRTFANNIIVTGDLTVNGTTTTVDATNLLVTDKLITLNDGGAASSGGGAGIEVEEDGSATGYIKVAADRAGWEFQAPGNSNTLTLDATASKTLTVAGDLTINADTTISSFGATIVDDANASAARTTLGVAIGSDVQAWDADLDTLAGMQSGAPGALALLTQAELEVLDGATVTTTELNLLDGGTDVASPTTTVVDADRFIINDNGTMTHVSASVLKSYIGAGGGSTAADDIDPGDAAVTITTTSGNTLINSANAGTTTISGSNVALTSENSVTVQGNIIPSTADGYSLGSSAAEWSDAYFADGGRIYFGNDQDVYFMHDADQGIDLIMNGPTAGEPRLTLRANNASADGSSLVFETLAADAGDAGDKLGSIDFTGYNSLTAIHPYAAIEGFMTDLGSAGETGKIDMKVYASASITSALTIEGTSTAGIATVDLPDHNGSTGGLKLAGTLVTATAAELNLLDGATAATSHSVVDADRVILNDGGTMKQVAMSDIKSYTGGGGGGGGAGGGKHGLTSTKTADFTTTAFASAEERQLYIVDSASAVTATLAVPAATTHDGYEVNIKRFGAGTVHITGSSGVLAIDGSATFDLPSQFSSVTLIATGSQFVII